MTKKPTYEELEKKIQKLEQAVTECKRTEEALRENEEKYRTLFKNMAQGAFYQRADGMLVDYNPAVLEMFGLTRDQFLSKTSMDPSWKVIHEDGSDFPGEQHPSMEAFQTGKPVRDVIAGVFNPRREDYVWLIINAFPQFKAGEDKPYQVFVTLHDITDRMRILKQLQEKRKELDIIFNFVPAMVWNKDNKGNYLQVNRAYCETVGLSKAKIIGRTDYDLYPADIADQYSKYDQEIIDLEKPALEIEEHHLKASGDYGWSLTKKLPYYDAEGNVVGTIGFATDITHLKQAEEALRESEEKYRSMMESMKDSVAICSDDYRVKYMNPAMIKRIGRDGTGERCFKAFHDLDEKCSWCRHYEMQQGKCFDTDIVSPMDSRSYQVSHSPIFHQDGSISKMIVFRDTTDLKKMETQLQQAQKMEAIGTLAGGIAHDFNNILSPIMIHSEMAMMELPSDSPVQNSLKQIYKAGERATDLTKQILTFSRMRQQERSPLKVGLIVKECLKMLRASLPTTIEINQDLETESDTVLCDITEINQILMNLCTNSAHAMRDKGGELTINLTEEHLDPDAAGKFPDLNPGSYLKLTVSDTGHGIDNETMKNIFEPYFTTKDVGEGTGMGLAVVHGIVRSYGGDITVESEPGKGTSFHVLLPAIEPEASPPVEPSVKLPKGTERILFVDDEKVAVDVIQTMLERLGYKVTARTSSIEALEVFRHKAEVFDLVITDMTMPNMTGDELAKELMSIRSDIPIILCTGFSEKIDEKKAMRMGIRAFVMKPIVMRQIANTIREVLDKK